MSILSYLSPTLRCPDDGGVLRLHPDRLVCTVCHREFPARDNYVSLVASSLFAGDGGSLYDQAYRAERSGEESGRASLHWAMPEAGADRAVRFKQRQVDRVGALLAAGNGAALVADFSAGPGYYTRQYARSWKSVIHGDLCEASLFEARARATQDGLDNILYVRMDYLRPPFHQTLPRVICLDSLIRGRAHERQLLRSILGALATGGLAVVDFHNWWHNPLRRLGWLPDNFTGNRSYSRRELRILLAEAGVGRYECLPFHQEIDPHSRWAPLAALGLPATRWMVRFEHGPQTYPGPA